MLTAFAAMLAVPHVHAMPAAPALSPDALVWPGATPEQLTFMKRVYAAHVARAASRGRFTADIPAARLAEVDKGVPLLAPAASDARAMLAAARTELAKQRAANDPAVGQVSDPAALSGYRTASHQFRLWNRAFPGYATETEPQRLTLPGGPMGDKAVETQMLFIRRHMAAPGFSLHNTGMALDVQTTEAGTWLQADRTQRAAWRSSWAFAWLDANAPRFRFHQNTAIDEPWHWEWRG
jgi:hypothetical protein